MTRRTERVSHLIQRELGEVIQRDLSDVRIGFVTISRVEVTTDLAHAKVYVSAMGDEKQKRDSIAGLEHSKSYLRTHLAKVMQTRTVPRLQFIHDKNLDHGFRIQELLSGLNRSAKSDEEAKESSSENPSEKSED